jgi:phenylacetic acid degradation protein paaN
MDPTQLFNRHHQRLNAAVDALQSRLAFTPFQESPRRALHADGAHAAGRAAFEARLGRSFAYMGLPAAVGEVGGERSPYTGAPLGITYPRLDPDGLYTAVLNAWDPWRRADERVRVGVCLEMLARWEAQVFENAYATMHTTGQGFMLAFAGSGASSLDRGLEGLAAAWTAMSSVTRSARYSRSFGGLPVTMEKRYRLMPVGVAVVLSCGSYPAWNAYPAILANLATGNPVVLKPHPDTILPMAMAVQTARAVLRDTGFDPNLLTLAADTWDEPIAKTLFARPETAIIDFTGGQAFGTWIERNCGHLQVYTETAGCNAVVLESAADLDAALDAIALGLVLFSAQMCTAPQNIWIPADGVHDGTQRISPQEVTTRLVAAVDRLVGLPKSAAALCGALHADKTRSELDHLCHKHHGRVLRAPTPYAHPEFPNARTATPLLVQLDPLDRAAAQRECFGPAAFVLVAKDRDTALQLAAADARDYGAIASYAYTSDPDFLREVEDRFAMAGASVGINLVRQRPMNFTAAFSDYHVTGLNPAGNACLTDAAFVSRRFRIVQCKVELPEAQ